MSSFKAKEAIQKIINETPLYRQKYQVSTYNFWHIVAVGDRNWDMDRLSVKDLSFVENEEDANLFTREAFLGNEEDVVFLAKFIWAEDSSVLQFAKHAFGFEKAENCKWIITKVEIEAEAIDAEGLLSGLDLL